MRDNWSGMPTAQGQHTMLRTLLSVPFLEGIIARHGKNAKMKLVKAHKTEGETSKDAA